MLKRWGLCRRMRIQQRRSVTMPCELRNAMPGSICEIVALELKQHKTEAQLTA